jgi:hypothetical protein
MPAGFIRRFKVDPGDAEIDAIEGVVILDRDPPQSIQGVGTSLVLLVAEFEDGPFGVVTQLSSGTDLVNQFGAFGYTYTGGLPGSNPCARARYADGALRPEYWNGNGYVATWGKTFGRLAVVRVDTSVGSVQFTALAYLLGGPAFAVALQSGATLKVNVGSGNVTATFSGAPAQIASSAGTYPSTFAGGESITFAIEGQTFTAFFLASDQSQAQVVARMNAAAGYNAFTVAGGGVTDFEGLVEGTASTVQIVSVSGGIVTTATGFTAGSPATGTGNVPNLLQVQPADANAVVHVAVAQTKIDRDANGFWRITNTATPGTGTISIDPTSTAAAAFGFPTGVTAQAAPATNGTIPAGTRVRDSSAHEWVTMQTIQVVAGNAGPYPAKVRPGLDDGSGLSALAGAANVVPFPVPGGAWSVVNLMPLSAALTEGQIDFAYANAIANTANVTTVAKQTNVIVSARQSNIVRTALRANVDQASENGCQGRTTCVRPPLGTTTRAMALSTTASPGVGTMRDERVDYCFPGANVTIPAIAAVGLAGGAGFTANGNIDVGADTWLASILSQLSPEQNPGQVTGLIQNVLAVEANNPDVQNMSIQDYKNFRAAGIAAIRVDDGDVIFQSGVNSIDPAVFPQLRNIGRRRMADYIEDSLAPPCNAFSKQLSTVDRRGSVVGVIDAFMSGLKSKNNPALARIQDYRLDAKTLNTQEVLDAGLFKIRVRAKTWPSLDVIVLDCTIGETVDLTTS